MIRKPSCRLPRSWTNHRKSSLRMISLANVASVTPPVISRPIIPHIMVYALGNYPYPLSRHSLPQSLLPLILERYGPISSRTKNANASKEQGVNPLKLLKKHECWVGGGLVDLDRNPYGMRHTSISAPSHEGSKSNALLTIVKPSRSVDDLSGA